MVYNIRYSCPGIFHRILLKFRLIWGLFKKYFINLISCVSKRVVMSLIKYIERLRRIDSLICMMATGTPEEFAEKLGIRRSTLFQSLQEMREMGVNIKYSCIRQSYYYTDNRRIKIKLENIFPEKSDLDKVSINREY